MATIICQTEFWAAIVGAVVGGLIAFCIQLKVLREGRKQRAEDRRESQQMLANALIFKIGRIYSNIRELHTHIEKCMEATNHPGTRREAWQVLQPIPSIPNRVFFTTEEMTLLMAMNDDDVFHIVLSLDDVHNDLWMTFSTLQDRREALLQEIKVDRFVEEVGEFELNREELSKLRPQMIMVNSIARQLRTDSKRALDESRTASSRVHKLLRKKLNLPYDLKFCDSANA